LHKLEILVKFTQIVVLAGLVAFRLRGQTEKAIDPGARPSPAITGTMMAGLIAQERLLFHKGQEAFQAINSVQGDPVIPHTESGLGPAFNLDSCGGCHAYPVVGGSSPPLNPQIAVARREGGTNRVPLFVRPDGPALQVRLRFHPDGTRDGLVQAIYTIAGRRDAGTCQMGQADLDAEFRRGNVSFRIATPLYGAGLIEAIPDAAIERNRLATRDEKQRLGISGIPHRDSRDGSIGRFGWKAQTRSLDLFSAEAYVVEQGVTNDLFPEERGDPPAACRLTITPEDRKRFFGRQTTDAHSNFVRVAHFLRFLAPAASASLTESGERGKRVFVSAGCGLCHTAELRTGTSAHAVLADKPVSLYSDLLLHHMGEGLADEIVQGQAGPDMFRTAPLWGLGQRIFLLHDGRTRNLEEAILAHADPEPARPPRRRKYPPSEANTVIVRFERLTREQKQDLFYFLRSL
jgi:CxxC motif-containing protein (DUF1111 family)